MKPVRGSPDPRSAGIDSGGDTHPIILDLGRFKLHSYGLMIFLAFVLGTWLAAVRARRDGIDVGVVVDLVVWILISSLVGARVTYFLFHLDEFRGPPDGSGPIRWLDIVNPIQSDGTIGIAGLVFLGGVVFAVPVTWLYLRRKGFSFHRMAKL